MSLTPPNRETIVFDFETDGSGTELRAGDIIDDDYGQLGLTISANQRRSKTDLAMIFDTDNPTGGDDDLDYSALPDGPGNILIISEDGDQSDPDDSARGGRIVFNFDEAVDLTSIVALDAERGGVFKAFDDEGNLIGKVRFKGTEDNGLVEVDLSSLTGVSKLVARVKGSGGLDDLTVERNLPPPPNTAPETSDLDLSGLQGAVLDGQVFATDADGDVLMYRLGDGADNGEVTLRSDGSFSYTPADGFFGEDSFTVLVDDGRGGEVEARVAVNIDALPPAELMARDDSVTVDEDGSVIIPLLDNDSPGEVGGIVIASLGTPLSGQLSQNADGTITYTPDPDFNGQDRFTYTISDFDLAGPQQTLNAAVERRDALVQSIAANQAQVASIEFELDVIIPRLLELRQQDLASAEANLQDIQNILDRLLAQTFPPASQSEIDNVFAQRSAAFQREQAARNELSLVILERGDLEQDLFIAQRQLAEDQAALPGAEQAVASAQATVDAIQTDTATVSITVNSVNDAPVAVSDMSQVAEDRAISIAVLANDTDVDSADVTVAGANNGANGTVVVNLDGTVTYTPNADFFGTDTFTYTATDGLLVSDPATVTVTVLTVEDDPIAVDDVATATSGQATTIAVLDNDSDPDGDPLVLVSVQDPENGSVEITPAGTIIYTPNANFVGRDTFEYVIGSTGPSLFQTELAQAEAERDLKAQALVDLADEEADLLDDVSALNHTIADREAAIVNLRISLAALFEELNQSVDVVNPDPTRRDPIEIQRDINFALDLIARDERDILTATLEISRIETDLAELSQRRLDAQAELAAATDAVAAVEALIATARHDTATVTVDVVADSRDFIAAEDGAVFIEPATANIERTGWSLQTASELPGALGDGALRWDGTGSRNRVDEASVLSFNFRADEDGTWALQYRFQVLNGTNPTEGNDAWFRLLDANGAPLIPAVPSVPDDVASTRPDGLPDVAGVQPDGGWFKVFGLGGALDWRTSGFVSDGDAIPLAWDLDAGTLYTLEMAGRGFGFGIDGIALATDGFATNEEELRNTSALEDARTALVSLSDPSDPPNENAPPVADDATFFATGLFTDRVTATDPDNDQISYSILSEPTSGSLILDSDGGFSYEPDGDLLMADSFEFVATDALGATDTGVVQILPAEKPAPTTLSIGENGLVIIEAESAATTGASWARLLESDEPGTFNATGALRYEGPESSGSVTEATVLTYRFTTDTAGSHVFQYRYDILDGAASTQSNDAWFRLIDESGAPVSPSIPFVPESVPTADANGFPIVSGPQPDGGWYQVFAFSPNGWSVGGVTGQNQGLLLGWDLDANTEYAIEMGGRNVGFGIDRFGLGTTGDVFTDLAQLQDSGVVSDLRTALTEDAASVILDDALIIA